MSRDIVRVVGLPGSLREASFNKALLTAATELATDVVRVELASFAGFPVYDGDLEAASGVPDVVKALKDEIAGADALLIATPEYNNSIPGPLKNAIDWLSRPPADIPRVFGGRPVGLIGATPGRGGTRLSQAAWLPVLRTLGTRPYFENSFYLDGAGQRIQEGALTDPKSRELLEKYLRGLAAFARAQR